MAGKSNQNLKLFNRGKCISWHPKNIGINQFPNPPIKIGITTKKIITKAWDVTKTLYTWSWKNNDLGCLNSNRIKTLKEEP